MPRYSVLHSRYKAYKFGTTRRPLLNKRKTAIKQGGRRKHVIEQDEDTDLASTIEADDDRSEGATAVAHSRSESDESQSGDAGSDIEHQKNDSDSEWAPSWAADSDSPEIISLMSNSESEDTASETEDSHFASDADSVEDSDDSDVTPVKRRFFDAAAVASLPYAERLAAWLAFHAKLDRDGLDDRTRTSTRRAFEVKFEPAPLGTALRDGTAATFVLRAEFPHPPWYPGKVIASDQPCFRCRLLMQTAGPTSTCQCLVPAFGNQSCLFCTVRHTDCDRGRRQVSESSSSPSPSPAPAPAPVAVARQRIFRSQVREESSNLAQFQESLSQVEERQIVAMDALRGWAELLAPCPPAFRFKRLEEVASELCATLEQLNYDKPERLDLSHVSGNEKAYWRRAAEVWKKTQEDLEAAAVWPPEADRRGPYLEIVSSTRDAFRSDGAGIRAPRTPIKRE